MIENEEAREEEVGRWVLIRDVAVFQVKLLLDGFRDLLLVPISLVTGLISLVNYGKESGSEFYDLLRLGRQTEKWINLFGAARRDDGQDTGEHEGTPANPVTVDEVVSRVETFIVDEYHKGGLTAQAKGRLDKALDSLNGLSSRGRKNTKS